MAAIDQGKSLSSKCILLALTCAHKIGAWTVGGNDTVLNAYQEFVFLGHLFDNATTVEVRLSLYNQKGNGSSAGLAFEVDAALAKMSLRISGWPWRSSNNTLSLAIPIDPPFASVVQREDSPQVGTTTYLLQGQYDARVQTTVRVLSAAEIDGGRIARVRSAIDVDASALTLTLPFFETNLTYDPGNVLWMYDRVQLAQLTHSSVRFWRGAYRQP